MPTLHRPVTVNRPKKTRISTPGGWVSVSRELIDGNYVEVARTDSSGAARALVVSHGFSEVEGAEAPKPAGKAKPETKAKATPNASKRATTKKTGASSKK